MQHRQYCPLCDNTQGDVVYQIAYDDPRVQTYLKSYYKNRQSRNQSLDFDRLSGEDLVIRYCSGCDFYWHEYILEDAGMKTLYEDWIDADHSLAKRNDWDRRSATIEQASTLPRLFTKQPADIAILDYGMGWGSFLLAMRAYGCEVHGVELSDCRRRYVAERGVSVYENLSDIDRTFDVIVLNQTLEHLPEPMTTLDAITDHLSPNGVIHITVPTVVEPPTAERVLTKGPFQPLEHINGFTRNALLKATSDFGLTHKRVMPTLLRTEALTKPRQVLKHLLWRLGLLDTIQRRRGRLPRFFSR